MNKISKFAATAILALTGISIALPASAIPTLRVTQGANVQTISDNGAGDFVPAAGLIFFLGTVGTYNVNVSGYTKPILGTAEAPSIDILSAQFSTSATSSTVVIEFSETDFNTAAQAVNLPSSIGGTTSGTVRYQTFASLSNSLFAQDILISDSGIMAGTPSFSFDDYATIALQGDYSLTTVMTITHGNGTNVNTSFNATVEISEPALISLVSLSGLLFIAGYGARRRQRRR